MSENRRVKDTGRPSVGWLMSNKGWLIPVVLGGVAVAYVVQQVNPQTIADFRATAATKQAEQACRLRLENRRYCVLTVLFSGATPSSVLECLK